MLTISPVNFTALLQTATEATAAYIDSGYHPVTGLPDAKVWETDRRKPCTAAYVLYLDLDGLKAVNDINGHAAGDRYIADAGAMLKAGFRRVNDAVYHPHGDEFIVLTDHKPNPDNYPQFSIGCAEVGIGGIAQAVVDADAAMYRAKAAKKHR